MKPAPPGTQALIELWNSMPVVRLSYPLAALPEGVGMLSVGNNIRAWVWSRLCAQSAPACIERFAHGQSCVSPDSCLAHSLFPLQRVGGAEQWRMATLFPRWLPRARRLDVFLFGEVTDDLLGGVESVMRSFLSLPFAAERFRGSLSSLSPGHTDCRIHLVTPWVLDKTGNLEVVRALAGDHVTSILNGMIRRGQRYTALCANTLPDYRLLPKAGRMLLSFAAHHIGNQAMRHLNVIEADLVENEFHQTKGDGRKVRYRVIEGSVLVHPEAWVLPWISLLAVCGGGDNPDKDFGSVELSPA